MSNSAVGWADGDEVGAEVSWAELAVIVPVYNEAERAAESIGAVIEGLGRRAVQVIVVDDGSTEGTTAFLREFIGEWQVGQENLLEHETNRGKGAAIRSGLEHVTADVVVIHDADLEYEPKDLPRLAERMSDADADVVYGSRTLRASDNPRRYNAFAWGVSLLNLAVRVLYGIRVTDEATCYKMFRTEDLRRMDLQCARFEFCPEVTAKAARMGLRIVEVPIRYRPRGAAGGKKIRLSDGIEALRTLWRYRRWQPAASAASNKIPVPHHLRRSVLETDQCGKP